MSDYVLEKITDYNEKLSLFLTQFQDSTKLNGIMSVVYNRANDIETALFEIRDEMSVDMAIGAQLDILGRIFNEDRQGRNDTDYRAAIQQKGVTIYSGEPEGIIDILKSIFEASYVYYHTLYPGKYYVVTDLSITEAELNSISPAGIKGGHGYYIIDQEDNYIIDQEGDYLIAIF
jgi:hypothetical protein